MKILTVISFDGYNFTKIQICYCHRCWQVFLTCRKSSKKRTFEILHKLSNVFLKYSIVFRQNFSLEKLFTHQSRTINLFKKIILVPLSFFFPREKFLKLHLSTHRTKLHGLTIFCTSVMRKLWKNILIVYSILLRTFTAQ